MLSIKNIIDTRKSKGNGFTIKPTQALRREYLRVINGLLDYIYKEFNRIVIKGMDTKKVEQQLTKDESYNDRLNRLIAEFERQTGKRITKKQLEKLCKKYLTKVYKWQNKQFKQQMSKLSLSLSGEEIIKGYRSFMRTKLNENVLLIQSLVDDEIKNLKSQVFRNITSGEPASKLGLRLAKHLNVSKHQAATIARTEVNKLSSQLSDKRAMEVGIEFGIWRGTGDNRERKSHLEAEGKVFRLSQGLKIDGKWQFPGQEPNCRCWTEYVLNI